MYNRMCVMCKSLEEARVWKEHIDRMGEPKTQICRNAKDIYLVNAYETEDCEWETPKQLMVELNRCYEVKTKPKPEPKVERKPSRFENIIQ